LIDYQNVEISTESNKVNKVELSTFFSWGTEAVISDVNEGKNGKVYVVRVWCQNCAKHKARINGHLRGKTKKHASAFIEGTTSVTKYQVSYLPNFGAWHPTLVSNWTSQKKRQKSRVIQ